jgi:UDP-glucose 4-epimerase
MNGNWVVTGASGFVGNALLSAVAPALREHCQAWVRRAPEHPVPGVRYVEAGDLAAPGWRPPALAGVEAIVHTAARVHVMQDSAADPLAEFRRVNVDSTLGLARVAAAAGVRRFVYLSSIKVLGERTVSGQRLAADDTPAPLDPYGVSKLEAEVALQQLARETGLEVVVLRPPLVYGRGVRANFLRMMRWVHRGVPLPLGALHNARSLVGVDNLADLILRCLEHPGAANQVFNVSDGEDVSTTDLLRRLAVALGRPSRLLPVPARLLLAGAAPFGLQPEIHRLCDSLQVDIRKTCERLSWTPPMSLDEGLRRTAAGFLAARALARGSAHAPP